MQSSHAVVFSDPMKPVRLDDFRNVLIRQEETIIFALIERAQFVRNREVYVKRSEVGSVTFGGLKGKYDSFQDSFLDFMFSETEKLHALARRYTSPDENAFYPHLLPETILPHLKYPSVLYPNRININSQIMSVYLEKILPGIALDASDPTSFGSTATADIAVLQALSKRIHFGKFIAEAKFQAERERYTTLIMNNDAQGIMEALTNLTVEEKVLKRVRLKASTYGQDITETKDASHVISSESESGTVCKVDPQLISDLYRDFVMPLTKEVQVRYLLQRLAHPSISVAGVEGSFGWLAAESYFGDKNAINQDHYVPRESISAVFSDVASNKAAYGVVPIEDSRQGMIKETQIQLLQSSLKVAAEIVVLKSVTFATKSMAAMKLGEISVVYVPAETDGSFLVHIEQCWPTARLVTVASVTEAAVKAAAFLPDIEGEVTSTAIALTTTGAAVAHGLHLVEGTNALATTTWMPLPVTNHTLRFLVIANRCPPSTGQDKSCLSMEITHQVGSLLNALAVWKQHSVNLCSLESIYRQDGGGYDFFVEIVGHFDDANVISAVKELQESVCSVKHLGSFPSSKRVLHS